MKDNNKIIFILLGILAAIILGAIILFAGKALSKKGNGNSSNHGQGSGANGEDDFGAPTLELTLSTKEPEQTEVTIFVVATPGEDDEEIARIVLPDKAEIYAATKEYTVTKNGTYEFKAVGSNGKETIEKIDVTNIRQISADNPYIPAGFEHIGGEVEDGFVIQDAFGNQYVWVPVPSGILHRETMMSTDYTESNSAATALVNSVAKYYGFYIARFEASAYEQDGVMAGASIAEKIPWTDINFRDAEAAAFASATVFGYEDAQTALISSYAWDTTLQWIEEKTPNYSSNTSYGNYSGTIYPTGSTESDQMNYICDLAGNVREWSTEEYSEVVGQTKGSLKKKNSTDNTVSRRAVRGGSANLPKIASSRNAQPEDLTDEYWGFRMVLFDNK